MAIAKIKKIQILATSKHKDKVLEALQSNGMVEIINSSEENLDNLAKCQKAELDYAQVEFAIGLLSNYGKKPGMLEGPIEMSAQDAKEKAETFDFQNIVDKCTEIEDKMVKAKNEMSNIQIERVLLTPWSKMGIKLENLSGTHTTSIILGSIKSLIFKEAKKEVSELSDQLEITIIHADKSNTYFHIVFSNELKTEINQTLSKYKFSEMEFPKTTGILTDYIKETEKKEETLKKTYEGGKKELTKLAENLKDLKIVHDYLGWEKEKLETGKKLGKTQYSFSIMAWTPEKEIPAMEASLNEITKEFSIHEMEISETDVIPVILQNGSTMGAFEAVTRVYGLPKYSEIDPTPFLSAYFIIFFALCLTDAGYGLVMFIIMALALKYMKLAPSIRKMVKLLMFGGIFTFFIGALFGGWFGLTPEQVPASLTYKAPDGQLFFIFQKISAVASPISVLILSLAMGYIQIFMGVTMKFIHDFRTGNKTNAILDTGTWVVMLSAIAFAILTNAKILPETLIPLSKWLVIGCAGLLVLTQGHEKKGIIGKFMSGVLSLYNLVGYLSDILSYSRILALGLATAIIGLAVNIVAALVMDSIPYVGWLFAIVVFIGGHVFNLLINALGSFIHSGRLQFVEFFTKFMEGGGRDFKPFSKKLKYLFLSKT